MDVPTQKTSPRDQLFESPKTHQGLSLTRAFLLQGVVLLALLTLLYGHVVAKLAQQWFEDPNYSHGFFVPLSSVLLLWMSRKSWMAKPIEPSVAGFFFVIAAMALLVVGTLGAELFLPRVSLCLLIGGLVLYFAGWPLLRAVLAPWLVLFLMIPLPAIVFNEVAFPLQLLASHLACSLLRLMQVPVLQDGNIIVLSTMTLDVVEACSGLRSLMSLITVAVVYGLFFERKVWMRLLLVLFAVPVAVLANALRITLSALLAQYVNHELAEGFFHAFSGFMLFVISLATLWVFHTFGSRFARRAAT